MYAGSICAKLGSETRQAGQQPARWGFCVAWRRLLDARAGPGGAGVYFPLPVAVTVCCFEPEGGGMMRRKTEDQASSKGIGTRILLGAALGLILGLALGAALGGIMDSMVLGITAGAGVGIVIGLALTFGLDR
jgi:hypothetical protein